MTSPLPFWQQIDGCVVINLDHRPDRWQTVSAQVARLHGHPEVTRLSACRGTELPGMGVRPWFRGRKTDVRWAARAGCMVSHRRAMLHARKAGWDTMLVLEDDCDLTPLLTCNFDVLHRVLFREHPEWNVCYLGHNEILPPAQRIASLNEAGELWRVGGCATTHAYLVRKPARDWIIEHTPEEESPWSWLSRHRSVDRWYGKTLSKHFSVFAFSPALLLQQSGYSDIGQNRVDWTQMEMKSVVPVKSGFHQKLSRSHHHARFEAIGDVLRGWWKKTNGF